MPDSSEREPIIEEHSEPGVLSRIRGRSGGVLEVLTPDEWERRTGMGDHVSVSFGGSRHAGALAVTPPIPAPAAGASVVCPACQGEGFLGWVGTASTCVFCLGECTVSPAEARRYDAGDPLYGAEPTLCRIKILVYQVDAYDRAREVLEAYGFTLERLEGDLDEDDLDRLWGYDGRNLAGRDFSAASYERWDKTDFSGSTLIGASFHEVDLEDAVFDAADLTEANLTGANLTRVSFRDATLSRANLDAAILFRADLTGANLSEALPRGSALVGADLREANLADAEVTGADVRGVKGVDPAVLADLRSRGAVVDEGGT
jgi:uncharacterized protein YjbI with pentapeptide repeats